MNVMAKWNPMQELDDFSSRLSTLFGADQAQKRDENGWFMKAKWAPLINISEDEQEYLIKADLPGVEKDQVKVTVENGLLLITGERTGEAEDKNKKHHRVESLYGTFLRSLSLPDNADGTKIKAEFKNGVLKVSGPNREESLFIAGRGISPPSHKGRGRHMGADGRRPFYRTSPTRNYLRTSASITV
jgi:HSP20 family protein